MSVKTPATMQQLERITSLSKVVSRDKFDRCYKEFTHTKGGELTERQAHFLILCLEGRWSGFKKKQNNSPIKETKAPSGKERSSSTEEMLKSLENIKRKLRKGE